MSPILGIYASQISGHLWAPSGAYDSIATVTVGSGGTSSITFSSIPSTYTHLELRAFSRSSTAGSGINTAIQFNADTGSNYRVHYIGGNGSSAFAGDFGASQTSGNIGWTAGTTDGANVFGTQIVQILDYSNTNKYKTIRSLNGIDSNGSGLVGLFSSLWMSTSAINRIDLSAGSLAQYSSFALYGIKGGN